MTLNDTQKALLTLLSQALWGNGGVLVEADWEQVEELAKDQGVLPMLYRGAMKYKDIIPAERIRIWRGAMYAAVLQNDHMNQAQTAYAVTLPNVDMAANGALPGHCSLKRIRSAPNAEKQAS